MSQNNQYDIIIIGSGIGALALASIMAKVNKKKVLILERHSKIGGYTHTFSRKKYKWDVGLHYIGRTFEKKLTGKIFSFITNNKLKWEILPEPFETFVYPDFSFDVFGNREKYQQDIIDRFPEEKQAIKKYFNDVQSIYNWFVLYYLCRFLPFFLRIPLVIINKFSQKKALSTTSEYFQKHFKDTRLKSLLTSQWGTCGMAPSKSAFVVHAIIVNHFIRGGCYPKGGSEEIANNIIPVIEQSGGTCLANHEVLRIIVKNNRAVGVETTVNKKPESQTEKYFAPVIVSNAGVFNTYTKLVPENVPIPFRKKCITMSNSSTCVALYIGLKDDITSLGILSSNIWIYDSYDHNRHYLNTTLLEGKPSSCYLSFIFQKDFSVNKNTAVVIAYVDHSEFEKWKHQTSGKRDKDYYDLKDKITSGLINFIDRRFPGFKKLVDFAEMSTPLTSEHYTAHPDGTMYGLPATPERYSQNWIKVKTPLKGLYITGCDVSSLGVVCSMLGGFATACVLNGPFGFFKLMAKMKKYSTRIE